MFRFPIPVAAFTKTAPACGFLPAVPIHGVCTEHGFYRLLFTGRHNARYPGDCRGSGDICFSALGAFGSAVQAGDETVYRRWGLGVFQYEEGTFRFRRKKVVVSAVKDISFNIWEGEIVGLLGENGAGKSTTIKMLTGVLFPTSGQINVLGYEPFTQRSRYVAHIGAVFGQKSQLIWDIPPLDSFLLNKAIYNIPGLEYTKRLGNLVALLGVADVIEKPTRVLSLGERMKCEFIMAMLHAPRVVFLDEPSIGVDLIAKEAIRDFIRSMNNDGVTFILTTHDLEDVERLAKRVIIINHGEMVFDDSLEILKKHLGDRKIVRIAMKSPVQIDEIAGIKLSRSNEREAELMVDHSIIPIDGLIKYISALGEILDISIKEMGIDAVIKSIYNNK